MTTERVTWAVAVILFMGIIATAIIGIWYDDSRLWWVALVMLAPLTVVSVAAAAITGNRMKGRQ